MPKRTHLIIHYVRLTRGCLLLWMLLLTASAQAQESDLKLSYSFQDQEAANCFKELEQTYGLQFSYNVAAINGIRISAKAENMPLQKAMELMLQNTALYHQYYPPKTVLIIPQHEAEPQELPTQTLCGYIRDARDKNPIEFATVHLPGSASGGISDEKGFYSFSAKAEANTMVEISYLGYQSQRVPYEKLTADACPTIYLRPDTNMIREVVVIDRAIRLLDAAKDGSGYELTPKQLNALPGWASPDVLRMVQLLPGISAEDELATQLSIRGGTPDQNLLLWEGIPVYHTGHFFGLQSIFNPAVVDGVEVHRGTFSSRFGGRVSGLLKIDSDLDQTDSSRFSVGANLLSLQGSIQVPLRGIKSKVLFSARRSFTDVWKNSTYRSLFDQVTGGGRIARDQMNELVITNAISSTPNFRFEDYFFKWQSRIGERTRLSLSTYAAQDELGYELLSNLDNFYLRLYNFVEQRNQGQRLDIEHQWKNGQKTRAEFIESKNSAQLLTFASLDPSNPEKNRGSLLNNLTDGTMRLEHEVETAKGFRFRAGYQASEYRNEINFRVSAEDVASDSLEFVQKSKIFSFYYDGDWQVNDRLQMDVGIRTSLAQGELFWEPRLHLDYLARPGLHLKAAMSWNNQFLYQIELPNDLNIGERQWRLAQDGGSEPIRSQQTSVGVLYKKDHLLLEAELYRKRLQGLATDNLFLPPTYVHDFSIGEGRTWGLDLLYKQKWSSLELWAAYSLSAARYQFPSLEDNRWFSTLLDQTHNLQLTPIFKLGRFDLAFIYQMRTGKPYTEGFSAERTILPNGENFDFIQYGPLNSKRLSAYQRIDFSGTYTFGGPHVKAKVGLSIYNLLNRKNVGNLSYELAYADDDSENEPELVRIERFLLRLTPNVFVEVEW